MDGRPVSESDSIDLVVLQIPNVSPSLSSPLILWKSFPLKTSSQNIIDLPLQPKTKPKKPKCIGARARPGGFEPQRPGSGLETEGWGSVEGCPLVRIQEVALTPPRSPPQQTALTSWLSWSRPLVNNQMAVARTQNLVSRTFGTTQTFVHPEQQNGRLKGEGALARPGAKASPESHRPWALVVPTLNDPACLIGGPLFPLRTQNGARTC